jgi:hypothetical protein
MTHIDAERAEVTQTIIVIRRERFGQRSIQTDSAKT